MFRSGRTHPAHAHGGVVAHPILGGLHLGRFECRFRKRQVTGYPEARNSGLRRAGQGDTKHPAKNLPADTRFGATYQLLLG